MAGLTDTHTPVPAPVPGSRVVVDEGHEPLVVTAHVPHGVATQGTWGIALDGLLAGQLHARWKHHQLQEGADLPRARDLPHPADLDLPLSRCLPTPPPSEHDQPDNDDVDLWHWAATTAMPTNGRDLLDDVRYWLGRLDDRANGQMTATLPGVVSSQRGRYRERKVPLLVTSCSHLVWRCVGDREAISALLGPVSGIGRRRGSGEGRVLSWSVTPAAGREGGGWSAGVLWSFAHAHSDGGLGRPSPAACVETGRALTGVAVAHAGIGRAGIRPPLAHPSRQRDLCWPTQLTDLEPAAAGVCG